MSKINNSSNYYIHYLFPKDSGTAQYASSAVLRTGLLEPLRKHKLVNESANIAFR